MSPEKGPFLSELSSSNHQFSGHMLVFRGYNTFVSCKCCTYRKKKPAVDIGVQSFLTPFLDTCFFWHLSKTFLRFFQWLEIWGTTFQWTWMPCMNQKKRDTAIRLAPGGWLGVKCCVTSWLGLMGLSNGQEDPHPKRWVQIWFQVECINQMSELWYLRHQIWVILQDFEGICPNFHAWKFATFDICSAEALRRP